MITQADPRAGRRQRRHDPRRHRRRGQRGRRVDFNGLAPDQTWAGEPNDFIVRESYMYDVDLDDVHAGRHGVDEDGGTGLELLEGPFAGELAADYDFTRALLRADELSRPRLCRWGRAIGPSHPTHRPTADEGRTCSRSPTSRSSTTT